MKQKRYYNIKIAIFAFVIWTILNITGISNIYIVNDLNFKAAIGKVLHLFFLYVLFLKTYNIFSEKKSENGKKRLKYFVLCFSILLFFLIIVWPGTWSWDDIIILQNISHLDFTPWQHFFSGLFYLLCLETIPIPAGVILIQVLIISVIFIAPCLLFLISQISLIVLIIFIAVGFSFYALMNISYSQFMTDNFIAYLYNKQQEDAKKQQQKEAKAAAKKAESKNNNKISYKKKKK